MASVGDVSARIAQSFRETRAAWPSIIALVVVAVFWVVVAVGGIGLLSEASSPMATLIGLYVGLAAVAVSIIIATLALNDLVRRYARQRTHR